MFLGEWCKLYERRAVWVQRDYETVQFHWDDRVKLKRDYEYLESLHHALLNSLAASLNAFHQVDHSVRYWQILLDPWLLTYVGAVFDRWECLRIVFAQHEMLEVLLPEAPADALPPFSGSEFILQAAYSDEWSSALCRRIIEREYADVCLIRREKMPTGSRAENRLRPALRRRQSRPWRFALGMDRFLGRCAFRHDVVFLDSYFNFSSLARLNLAIGQVPRLFIGEFEWGDAFNALLSPSVDQPGRAGIRLDFSPKSAFEEFIRQSIPHDAPRCVVEDYRALRDRANNVTLKAKVVVTANSHWNNVYAKAWMAEQTGRGVKLVTLEHGGSLPAYKELFGFEEDISDVRGTWFLPYHPKHVQLPPPKLINRFTRPSSGKYCALIGVEQPRWVYRAHFYPMAAQCLVSLDMVVQLYERLDDQVKQCFRAKPYPSQGWNTRQRYIDVFGAEKILSEKKIDRVFGLSRVIVCTYPETTFSEAMASDVPVVLIYPECFYERHPVALPLLEVLRSASIVFHDPVAAAAHINTIWNDPAQWWDSARVLHARKTFRRQASDFDGGWLKKWTHFLASLKV